METLQECIPIATDITTNAIGETESLVGGWEREKGRVACKSRDDSGLFQDEMHPWLNPRHSNVERIKPGYTLPSRSGEPENGIMGRDPAAPFHLVSLWSIVWQPYWNNSQPRRDWSVF